MAQFKGDRMPVGIYPRDKEPFTLYDIEIQSNDVLYLFTDGFADQIDSFFC